jgi:hypothetical protein
MNTRRTNPEEQTREFLTQMIPEIEYEGILEVIAEMLRDEAKEYAEMSDDARARGFREVANTVTHAKYQVRAVEFEFE